MRFEHRRIGWSVLVVVLALPLGQSGCGGDAGDGEGSVQLAVSSKPSLPKVTQSGQALKLTWTGSDGSYAAIDRSWPGCGGTCYKNVAWLSKSATSWTDTTVSYGVPYRYKVYNKTGNSGYSQPVTPTEATTTPPLTPPLTPPGETEELITNGEFDDDLAGWSTLNGAAARITWNGSDRNARVEDIADPTSGLGQAIAISRISQGDELHATAHFMLAVGSDVGTAFIRARLVDDAGTSYITLAQAGVNGWTRDTEVTGSATVTWTGTLSSLTLFATTSASDFIVDSVSVERRGGTSVVPPQSKNLPLGGFLFGTNTEYGQPHASDWPILMPWAESTFDHPTLVGSRWMSNSSWDAILAVDREPTWMLMGPSRDWLLGDTQNRVLLLALPPFPNFGRGHDVEREQWKAAARGDFNSYYTEFAKRVTALYPNDGNTIITRFAWEFDGDWYHFGTSMNAGDTQWGPYVREAFRHFVNCFEAVRPATLHSWNLANIPNEGQIPLSNWREVMDAYYPGNDVVDFVDLDLYDYFQWSCGNDPGDLSHHKCRAGRAQAWIDVLRQYAQEKNKPIAHSEWGLWSTTDPEFDNSAFVETMWNHLLTGDVAYHSYFNAASDGAERRLHHPELANTLSTYKQMGEASATNWLRQ